MVALIYATIILIVAFHWAWNRSWFVRKINEIPGLETPNLPIFGNSLDVVLNAHDAYGWFHRKLQALGGIFRVWILGQPMIIFVNAKYANMVLKSTKYIPKGDFYALLSDFIHLGYKYNKRLDREEHKRRRKIGSPVVQLPSMLQEFVYVFNKCSGVTCERLKKANSESGIEVFNLTACCSFDIMYETVLGVPGTAQTDEGSFFQDACEEIIETSINRYFTPWLRPNLLWHFSNSKQKYEKSLKIVSDFSDKVIRERKTELKLIKDDPDFKVRYILDNGILLDDPAIDADLRYTVQGFIFAGYDTTGTTMGWFLSLMGTHPEIQDKVVEELVEVFGDSGRMPDLEDLDKLKYLDMCLKETLRQYPALPIIERRLSENLQIDNYTIPASTTVLLFIYGIHRNPEHYPDPEKYDPERFSMENSKERTPGSFMPFSGGEQSCFGQKFAMIVMKCVLSTILRRYRIETVSNMNEMKLKLRVILRPQGGLYIRAFERDSHPNLRVL